MKLRKLVNHEEEVRIEGGRAASPPLKLYAVAAVLASPWAGRGFVEDLKPEIRAVAPLLGEMLTQRILGLAGGGDRIEAYGKTAIAGLDCEQEHASALIHTLQFGNYFRKAVEAKSYLAFTNIRGPANTQIQIPLMDKHDAGRRSHYLTIQFSIHDAPSNDEIVVALGASSGGRPHHRIGDRYQDLKEMGAEADNPAKIG